ncbi:hypothetical protein SH449x_005277 [Pirellulaceae bacterium SH449]
MVESRFVIGLIPFWQLTDGAVSDNVADRSADPMNAWSNPRQRHRVVDDSST